LTVCFIYFLGTAIIYDKLECKLAPRPSRSARLWLRRRVGRTGAWVILDHGREIRTGAGENDLRAAENALAEYLANKRRPQFGDGHPSRVLIADVLAEYGEHYGPTTRRADLIGVAIGKLVEFFGDKTLTTITSVTCNAYVRWRIQQVNARAKKHGKPIKESTARRELVVLGAALRWCWKEGKVDRLLPISLPPQPGPRQRHLNRTEVAALLAGALGWDRHGVRHRMKINRHLARFILIALYTGTRHDAILRLQWKPNTESGWIDLASAVMYRRASGAVDKGKRRPPVPITSRLLAHLHRWRRSTTTHVIEYAGRPLCSKERRAWRTARELAELDADVTPHVLRHTCATMLLQLGVSVYDVAGVLGASEDVVRRTYGHHAHDHLRQAVAAFSRPHAPMKRP
jgi:integrase